MGENIHDFSRHLRGNAEETCQPSVPPGLPVQPATEINPRMSSATCADDLSAYRRGGKRCPRCWVMKGSSEFYRSRASRDGMTSYCKTCTREYHQEMYTQNKKSVLDARRAYYKRNKAYISKRAKMYYAKNKARIIERRKKYREARHGR